MEEENNGGVICKSWDGLPLMPNWKKGKTTFFFFLSSSSHVVVRLRHWDMTHFGHLTATDDQQVYEKEVQND